MGGAAYGNGKIALDLGIRWSYQRTDVCGPADAPTRCAQRFLGVPIRLIMKFGPIGAEIEGSAAEVAAAALEHRLLVTTCGPGSIRLTPPLTVSAGLVDQALATLREVLA